MMICRRDFLSFVAVISFKSVGIAQEKPGPSTNNDDDPLRAEAARQFEYFAALAQKITAKLASGKELQQSGKSVLNWTIGSSWHGSFFVWVCEDRPVLVGCMLADSENSNIRRGFIELHSMSDQRFTPLKFAAIKNYEWDPDPLRTKPVLLSHSSAPDSNARLRGTQLREIAEQFSVTMFEEEFKGGKDKEQLRMLPRPLYRYPDRGDQALDGAIFAYVTSKGTDPEFLLAIECSLTGKNDGWLIRPLRYCTRKLELRRGDELVWSVAEYDESRQQTKLTDPYMIITLFDTDTASFNAIRKQTVESRTK